MQTKYVVFCSLITGCLVMTSMGSIKSNAMVKLADPTCQRSASNMGAVINKRGAVYCPVLNYTDGARAYVRYIGDVAASSYNPISGQIQCRGNAKWTSSYSDTTGVASALITWTLEGKGKDRQGILPTSVNCGNINAVPCLKNRGAPGGCSLGSPPPPPPRE